MKNIRETAAPRTTTDLFEYKRGMPKGSRVDTNPHWVKLKEQIDSGYFEFAICFWGNVGKMTVPDSSAAGSVFYIRPLVDGVREAFESIDWKEHVSQKSIGAPQLINNEMIEIIEKFTNHKKTNQSH